MIFLHKLTLFCVKLIIFNLILSKKEIRNNYIYVYMRSAFTHGAVCFDRFIESQNVEIQLVDIKIYVGIISFLILAKPNMT
jgi:hypothetical protein